MRINPEWKKQMKKSIDRRHNIDYTTSLKETIQFLIISLSDANIPYKLYNLGAGVKRITTITDICPCCRKKL